MNTEKVVGKLTAAAILAELQAVTGGAADVIPPGWKTVKGWADFLGKSSPHMNKLCRHAHEAGIMERKVFRKEFPDGVVRPAPHYRHVGKKK